jgi:hypothetical protein
MKKILKHPIIIILLILVFASLAIFFSKDLLSSTETYTRPIEKINEKIKETVKNWPEKLDKEDYDKRILNLAQYTEPKYLEVKDPETGEVTQELDGVKATFSEKFNAIVPGENWPAKAVYPNGGAILPFYRVLAYYGNFYSTRMGILGEFEKDEVIRRLFEEKENWEKADPNTPVMPAIHYIAMVAQGDAGSDGMYRNVMPDEEIEKAYDMAKEIDAILFLDIQVGLSTLDKELHKFNKFLERPEVHFGIDPEFSMKGGEKPGTVIGSFNADDINYTINWMSEIVKEHNLPPKILVIHRFTDKMVKNYEQIKPTPEVQVVMDMDGWGPTSLKYGTYSRVITPEPVQFSGVKIFYKNDLKEPSTGLWQPETVLDLTPAPIYIQYQ